MVMSVDGASTSNNASSFAVSVCVASVDSSGGFMIVIYFHLIL